MSIDNLKKTAAGNLALAIYEQTNGSGETISKDNFNTFLNSIHVPPEKHVTDDVPLQQAKEIIMRYSIANANMGGSATDVCREWKANLGITFSNPTSELPTSEPTSEQTLNPIPEPQVGRFKQERRELRQQREQELAAINDEYEQVVAINMDEVDKFKRNVRQFKDNVKSKGNNFAQGVNDAFDGAKPGKNKTVSEASTGELLGSAIVNGIQNKVKGVYKVGKFVVNRTMDNVEMCLDAGADASAKVDELKETVRKKSRKLATNVKYSAQIMWNKTQAVISTVAKGASEA